MWNQYRKTALPTQIAIIVAVVALLRFAKVPLMGVAVLLIAMEIGAVIGAWWAARLTRKLGLDRNRLPLCK